MGKFTTSIIATLYQVLLVAIRLTSTYVYNSTYVYTFDPPMKNVKPAQPGLANRMAGKSWFRNLVGRGANLFLLN